MINFLKILWQVREETKEKGGKLYISVFFNRMFLLYFCTRRYTISFYLFEQGSIHIFILSYVPQIMYRELPKLTMFQLTIFCLFVFLCCKSNNTFRRNCTLNFEFWSFPRPEKSGWILYHVVGQQHQAMAPSQPHKHEGKQVILYGIPCCKWFFWIRCFVFTSNHLQNAHLCLLLLVRRGRQLITLDMKLKILTQL